MSVKDRDPVTGHKVTGHEWNGIKELNTPVPKIVWLAIAATVIWSLIIWVLMPAWPAINTHTKGLLGVDQRDQVAASVQAANDARADWVSQIEAAEPAEILADPGLLAITRDVGHQLFGDNCAACHGQDAGGGPGFPSLTDNAWLWGGQADVIQETLRVGINSAHPDTRVAQMLAFGRDGILSRHDVHAVTAHVISLSGQGKPDAHGSAIFAENCVACHQEDGAGSTELGAPDLTDDFWIYGGDRKAIFKTVYDGRNGVMPTWEDRLTLAEQKILTSYILDKHEGGQ